MEEPCGERETWWTGRERKLTQVNSMRPAVLRFGKQFGVSNESCVTSLQQPVGPWCSQGKRSYGPVTKSQGLCAELRTCSGISQPAGWQVTLSAPQLHSREVNPRGSFELKAQFQYTQTKEVES